MWPQASGPFCHAHQATWRANGRGDPAEFAQRFAAVRVPADKVIDLTRLAEPLRWEVAYAIQCRHDQRTSRTPPEIVARAMAFLTDAGVTSLADGDERTWGQAFIASGRGDGNARAFVVFAHRCAADLAAGSGWDGTGWDAEYRHDVWRLRRLGHPGNLSLDFTSIDQPWLRGLAKQWARQRMSCGVGLEAVRRGLTAITRLAGYLRAVGLAGPDELTRTVIEGYLADLSAGVPSPGHRQVHLGQLRAGLRVGDATALAGDCLVTDPQGGGCLRYVNHKMNREALVPVDDELHALITAAQARLAERTTDRSTAPVVLFPRPTRNPDQSIPLSSSTYRAALYRWLESLHIRDEYGHRAHLTPHQWRHTLGTRLINRDVPQEVVRRILDHESPQMTAHYARLHDSTVRRHWDAARKVDITGATITTLTTEVDGLLADAAWAGHRLATATQALPNGHGGLPIQKACPHANACLTCPMFLTTAQHLPTHREHRTQVIELVTRAQADGRTRVAHMNQQVLTSLEAIITGLEQPGGTHAP